MFDGIKNVTSKADKRLSLPLQNLLWYMVESSKAKSIDHLQVFILSRTTVNGITKQKIVQMQTTPEYRYEYSIDLSNPVNEKVYIIDNGTKCTMLLAEEFEH